MISRRSQRPSARDFSFSPRETSPGLSVWSDCDADDESTMSSEDQTSARSLTVNIPQFPLSTQRPTLAEILSNTAPPPWTLSAFMAYLSQNHCLETLEFTMDASRYRQHFDQMEPSGPASAEGCEYVKMLWRRLLDAYIIPDGPREVNLPSDVRDQLLSLSNSYVPPPPDSLEPAVKIIYDLMDESVLVPFLNHVSGYRAATSSPSLARSSDEDIEMQGSGDEASNGRSSRTRRGRRGSSPHSAHSVMEFVANSFSSSSSGHQKRPSRTSNVTPSGFGRSSRLSPRPSNSSDNLTEDVSSPGSPGHEPMTPPTTPPTSDAGGVSPTMSPRSRADVTWKRMTGKLGFKKPSRNGLHRDGRMPGIDNDTGAIL
ncbi:MAG: hypothetical protein M1838_004442 [Thelocarpon superellum]|nr:MAG: hypothetical protein M1838_004442 [Thelocarpon superellum]